eukprot:CAMPEP_0113399246 /NCGR_PEP_ID=MMETSP0013_2-20120614/15425_1 /TAXON_ID=2843 ORGANISM="Skeletonema costatum, Strain 1716" /NCGR_SAMPLE_ID=MMETSP0013_2 /ASSEMBLY_ACC=CAM_ASM_000158 /LENGTH=817 /DNA_ID=CAMNT_0000284111 /DNA_START=35 /DNA_END=2488 /DNA_ORIENTATION=+ /assembly_acc=CAM_ASM_000158
MKIFAPLAAASLCVASRVMAFSPPMHQHRRAAVLSSAVAKETDTHIVETPASSTATKDAAERLDDIIDARVETEQERTVSSTSQQSEESTMELFVTDMRSVYSDLENGGGSIKVRMANVGASFTYVAPSLSSSSEETNKNKQIFGGWRKQVPTLYDSTTIDWGEVHSDIVETQPHSGAEAPPMLIYLPGLDGLGMSATAQFDDLASTFELWRMTVDKSTAQPSFSQLVSTVVKFVKDSTNNADAETPREVILVGESFGGLLTCAVAMALKNVKSNKFSLKGMTLINPATSFDETNWEQFVPLLTSLRYLESQEDIVDSSGNFNFVNELPTPYSVLGGMALAATIPDGNQFSSILEFILGTAKLSTNEQMLAASADGFRLLAEYLPASVLETRVLQWLPVGTSVVNNVERLTKLDVPTLVIAGNDDNMLPTKEEANRLGKLLPDCVKMEVSGAGHFVLDARVNLTEVLIDSHIDPLDIQKNSPPYDPVRDWKLPPDDVVRAVVEKRVNPTKKRASPVFFSTDATGQRRLGLSLVPTNDRPLLIVGNHQLFGQDLGMIISQLLEDRNIVARGLAHPTVAEGLLRGEQEVRTQRRRYEFGEDVRFEGDLFQMFGAVKVSPRNFFRLLQTNQTALLFPGGVKEALHGKGDDYKLFWPEKTDFVRIAAKFNATIVPLSAIGAADSADIVADANELLNLPFGIGENLANFSKSTVSARFDAKDDDETFIPPLAVPKPFPARHYFLFGRSFDTTLLDPNNKDECQRIYRGVKNEVEEGIDALLSARKDDPYALDGVKRSSYQRLFGKDPPTFPLSSLPKSSSSV